MAVRMRVPLSRAPRCLGVGRQYSNSNSRPSPQHHQTKDYNSPSTSSDSKPTPAEASTPDPPLGSSASKIFIPSNPIILARRPSVKPPPTLALPPSMAPPAPRPSPPGAHAKGPDTQNETSGSQVKAFDIYLKSLGGTTTEPTIEDLDALRPPPQTIRAALDGVLGTGRTLLPEGHSLHLAMEQLGAQEVSVGGGPTAKQKVTAGSRRAKKMEYAALYEATEGLISRRFTAAQLRKFEKESRAGKSRLERNFPGSKSASKQKIIHSIMGARWSMIHPSVIKKQLEEAREIVEETYPVSPSELFILLGRDGEELLQVARRFHLSISVDRETPAKSQQNRPPVSQDVPNPAPAFILRAAGVRQDHKKLKKHLEEHKKAVAIRMVVLPTGPPLSSTTLQSISRVAGAFVENVHSKFAELEETEESTPSVLITARDARSAYTAERLVQRAALEDAHRSQLPLISLTLPTQTTMHEPEEAQSNDKGSPGYALYPFDTQGFRLQRVKLLSETSEHIPDGGPVHWQYKSSDEDFILSGGSNGYPDLDEADYSQKPMQHWVIEDEASTGDVVATTAEGNAVDIYELLFGEAADAPSDAKKILTATFGHVLFKAPGSSALISSLEGPTTIESALEWARNQGIGARSFTPGLVPPLAQSTLSAMTPTHRLQYRTIDGRNVVNVNVELPDESPAIESVPEGSPLANGSAEGSDGLELVSPNDRVEVRNEDSDFAPGQDAPGHENDSPSAESTISSLLETAEVAQADDLARTEPILLPSEITIGTETILELMLPDSTMDVTLKVADIAPIASQVPEALKKYLEDLSTFFTTDVDMFQPDPPQAFTIDEKYYVLAKNTTGRIGVETIHTDIESFGCTVLTETALDLENNTRSSFTQVSSNGTGDKEDWERFIRLCRKLAAQTYVKSNQAQVPVP